MLFRPHPSPLAPRACRLYACSPRRPRRFSSSGGDVGQRLGQRRRQWLCRCFVLPVVRPRSSPRRSSICNDAFCSVCGNTVLRPRQVINRSPFTLPCHSTAGINVFNSEHPGPTAHRSTHILFQSFILFFFFFLPQYVTLVEKKKTRDIASSFFSSCFGVRCLFPGHPYVVGETPWRPLRKEKRKMTRRTK